MNNKFIKLILLLQTNLKRKTEEKDEILNKKRKVTSKLKTIGTELSEKTTTASYLRTDLKKYNRYYLKLVESILYIIFTAFAELVDVSFYAFVLFTEIHLIFGNPFNLLNALLSIVVLAGMTAFCYTGLKSFIGSQKSCIEDIKEGRRLRKKYKSNKDIEKELELVEANIASLTSELNSLNEEEELLNIDLENISSELVKLKRKLHITNNAFIQSSIKVQGEHIEEDLDKEYDESHIEEQVESVHEGKRFGFQPKQRENQ